MLTKCSSLSLKFLLIFFLQYELIFSLFSLSPKDLSLEEKVGQLFMVHFNGKEANENANRLIRELYVGGIIYYNWANDLSDPCQVQRLSSQLQNLAKKTPHAIPLLIAVDQEGGKVNRLKNGVTIFPGNYALRNTRNLQYSESCAEMIGKELKALGISLNLAPVVDVWKEVKNPVIGIRAFSSDAQEVALWGKATVLGYQKAGIASALKHFPGHGDVLSDSHYALPALKKTRSRLDSEDLLPFRLLSPLADVIMTAHLSVPALDADSCSTFSIKTVKGILRNEFGFSGVIMTDSLAMQGVLNQTFSLEEAALKSIEAGHDLILLGGKQLLSSQEGWEVSIDDVQRIHQAVVDAVQNGRLTEDQLDAAVDRILALKQKKNLFNCQFSSDKNWSAGLDMKSHQAMAAQIAKDALCIIRQQNLLPLNFESLSLLIVAPELLGEELSKTDWQRFPIVYYQGLNPDNHAIEQICLIAKKYEHSLLFSYEAWQHSQQKELFNCLKSIASCPMIIVCGNPHDCASLQDAPLVLCTLSPVACSLQAAFDYLCQPSTHDKALNCY